SGLTVSFASQTTTVCTVSGTTATFLEAGSCTIQATQAGNATYAAATPVSQSFTVNTALLSQTITFVNPGTQTVGTPLTLSATASSGLTVSFASQTASVCTVSGTAATFLEAGTCTIQATQAGNATYAAATVVSQSFTVNTTAGVGWTAVPLVNQASINAGDAGGEGGQVPQNIAIDPTGNFLIFGTDVGGIYKSLDGGANWQPANVGFAPRGATAFAIDPNNTSRILAVGCNGAAYSVNGLWLSTDQAATWSPVLEQNMQGSGTYHDSVTFDPSSASGGFSQIAYWVAYSDGGGGLWKSVNGGVSWNKILSTFPDGTKIEDGIVKVHPTLGYVYVATANGFYLSINGGASFTKEVTGSVLGLDVISTYPNNVYINESDGVYFSTNSGQSFTKMASTNLPTTDSPGLRNLKVSPANPSNMLIDDDQGQYDLQGWYYSNDGGDTWHSSSLNSTLSFLPENDREHLYAWHPTNASEAWSFGGDFISQSTDAGPVFSWSNNGYNAYTIASMFNFNVQNPDLLVVTSQDYDSSFTADGGTTWLYLNASGLGWGGFTYGGYALGSTELAVGVAPGWGEAATLYLSSDSGNTWTDTGDLGNTLGTAIGDPAGSSYAYWDNWRTADGGSTWTKMTGVDGVFAYNPSGTMELYGASGNTVVKSVNHGANWQTVVNTNDSNGVSDIAFDGTNNRLYITTAQGEGTSSLYEYDLTAQTLTNISSRLPADNQGNSEAATVAVDPGNTNIVYVGWHGDTYMSSQAVRRSINGGQTWAPLTLQPGGSGIDGGHEAWVVRVNPSTHYLWVGGECFGIWKYPPPGS
ncbi:MAG: hypothetical protein WBP85_16930, partial [Terracidiphilus sp.]